MSPASAFKSAASDLEHIHCRVTFEHKSAKATLWALKQLDNTILLKIRHHCNTLFVSGPVLKMKQNGPTDKLGCCSDTPFLTEIYMVACTLMWCNIDVVYTHRWLYLLCAGSTPSATHWSMEWTALPAHHCWGGTALCCHWLHITTALPTTQYVLTSHVSHVTSNIQNDTEVLLLLARKIWV